MPGLIMECARALLLLHCFHGVRRQMRRLASTASQACRFLNLPTTFNIPAKSSNDGIPAFVALDRGAASPPEFRGALARLNASPPRPGAGHLAGAVTAASSAVVLRFSGFFKEAVHESRHERFRTRQVRRRRSCGAVGVCAECRVCTVVCVGHATHGRTSVC